MKKNVLIVEDDALLSVLQTKIVEQIGHHVVTGVKTGEEAVTIVKEKEPDIILMDMSLGGEMDGIATMQKIRKFSSVPVIYLSGSADAKLVEKTRSIQPVDYLIKPVDRKKLEVCFEKAFMQQC